MFIIGDPEASANLRLMQAVEGEGLPRLTSPFEHGNLFLILNIEFPTTLPAAAAAQLLKVLPPPKHVPTVSEDSDDVEVVTLKAIDPVKSDKEHLAAQPAARAGQTYGGFSLSLSESRQHSTSPSGALSGAGSLDVRRTRPVRANLGRGPPILCYKDEM